MFTVKQIRVDMNLSQPEMAKKLGMHVNTYRNKENGLVRWTLDEASMLSRLCGKEISEIKF